MNQKENYYPEKSAEDIFPQNWGLEIHDLHGNIEHSLNNFHEIIDDIFKVHGSSLLENVGRSKFSPAARQWRNDTEHIIDIEVPGMDKEEINVVLTEKSIVVEGEKKNKTKQDDSSSTVYYGRFHREFSIPKDVNAEDASSTLDKGVLTVKLPIKIMTERKPRSLEID